jgi:hypothetical protein
MKVTESQLRDIIKSAALNVLKESVDELSPELLKHAADKRGEQLKDLGRARKDEPSDIADKREKFRAQRDNFKKGSAEALEREIGDPRIHVHSDLRTMTATGDGEGMEGRYQIHHRPGMDIWNPKVYDNSLEQGLDNYPNVNAEDAFPDYKEKIAPSFERFNKLHGVSEAKIMDVVKQVIKEQLKHE